MSNRLREDLDDEGLADLLEGYHRMGANDWGVEAWLAGHKKWLTYKAQGYTLETLQKWIDAGGKVSE